MSYELLEKLAKIYFIYFPLCMHYSRCSDQSVHLHRVKLKLEMKPYMSSL